MLIMTSLLCTEWPQMISFVGFLLNKGPKQAHIWHWQKNYGNDGNTLKDYLFKMSGSLLGQLRPGWVECPYMKCWQPYYLKSQTVESFMRNHCCDSFHSVACCWPATFRMRIMNGPTGFSRFKHGIQLNFQLSKPLGPWFNTKIISSPQWVFL